MVELWFIILCVMVMFFIVLSGWDFGAGALHFVVARNREERRELIAAIGPLWTWNEVWLVATGGVLFVAFPRVLAVAFPAYYLALFLVLWALLLRGIALEFRGHNPSPLWRSFWDLVFASSNVSLALLFGAAFGNVIRGVPLGPDGDVSLPLFTNFGVRGELGILDWYTVAVAVFTLVCLCAHGASYLSVKADGELCRRSMLAAKWLWMVTLCLLVLVSLATWRVRPELFTGMAERPTSWGALVLVVGGLAAILTGLKSGLALRTFAGGCSLIAGLFATAAASLFPVMLHSTLAPEYSMTAYNGSSDSTSLRVAAYWWPAAFALTLFYFAFVAKHYRGRIELSRESQQPY
jgi:cytochrome d ubiquinol oxidase subunit II